MRATVAREPRVAGSARRGRERRLRAWWRHEQFAFRCALASAHHHSHMRMASVAAQTDDEMPAAPCAATASLVAIFAATPAPAAPAPEFDYVAPTLVMESIAPAPAVILPEPSQQLPPVFSTATVVTGVNLSPQFSNIAVEISAPQVSGSLPPFEEFTEPGYNQVHQEQIVTGEMTLNSVEHPVVQEQVIIPEITPVVERIQEQIIENTDVTPQASQIALNTSSTSTSQFDILSWSSTSTSGNHLDELASMLDSCLEQLTPLAGLNEELQRIETLTKRLLEPPLPEPSMVEPSLPASPGLISAKRRRRTRYTPLPGIMEHAVYLAPSAWPPIRHA